MFVTSPREGPLPPGRGVRQGEPSEEKVVRIRNLGIALALLIGILTVVPADAGTHPQDLFAKLTKKKNLPKKKKVANGLIVKIDNNNAPERDTPRVVQEALISVTKNVAVKHKAVPKCTQPINEMTSAQARAACGSSKVSVDSGTGVGIAVDVARGAVESDGVLTVFNGPEANQLSFHADFGGPPVVLVGTVEKAPGAAYGKAIRVPVTAPVPIRYFYVKIKNGKFIVANCLDRTPDFKAKNTYAPAEKTPPYTSKAKSTCKRK